MANKWMKQLENVSARAHISRLGAIQLQMQQHIEELYEKEHSGHSGALEGIYTDEYYRTASITRRFSKRKRRTKKETRFTAWSKWKNRSL